MKKLLHGQEHLGLRSNNNNSDCIDSPRASETDRGMKAGIRYLRNLGSFRRLGIISPTTKEAANNLEEIKLKFASDNIRLTE